jgi:hypothetical protein
MGRKLIGRMGWCVDDGKGLGLHGQGRLSTVRIIGRAGRSGLGSERTAQVCVCVCVCVCVPVSCLCRCLCQDVEYATCNMQYGILNMEFIRKM